jgi:ADP-ribose pyrophosphatase YjhB (NUDIX family)
VLYFRYCPECGARLQEPSVPDRTLRQDCPACGTVHYHNAKPCAGALIERGGKLLLARRGIEPFKGWWDIPGGFLEPWEDAAAGAAREVREETGLEVLPETVLAVITDRYGAGGDYTLNVFYAVASEIGEPRPADDVSELRWFAPDSLPQHIAFENGRRAVEAWLRRRTVAPPRPRGKLR